MNEKPSSAIALSVTPSAFICEYQSGMYAPMAPSLLSECMNTRYSKLIAGEALGDGLQDNCDFLESCKTMNSAKQRIRESIWKKLTEAKVGAFPFPLDGRVPNFKGASQAAERLSELEIWQSAKTIKSNPDAPQRPVREKALRDGKRVFMAVPRLLDVKPFRELNPEKIRDINKAVSIKGGMNLGIPTCVEELPPIDLIIAGSVAVNKDGRRLGRGYSDLEFALASHYGKITDKTLIVTTIHQLQITDHDIPMEQHDISVDFIITPETVIKTNTRYPRPSGIFPEILSEVYIENIPVIAKLIG